MTCRACRHEFCWVCCHVWGGNHACNQYAAQNDQNASKVNVERYKHYFTRYTNHSLSLKLELRLYKTVEEQMKRLQELDGMTRNQVLFLRHAIDVLCKSRQILSATYVFAYFSDTSTQLMIFEDNQRDLETATEALSGCLENEITDNNLSSVKKTLQERSAYCDRRQKVLMEHINEGYKEGWWGADAQ